jgi:hypothetical protein
MDFGYPTYSNESDRMEPSWNAYIFTNFFTNSPWSCCDIGMIASTEVGEGNWKPVFNLNGTMISPIPDGEDDYVVLANMTEDKETGLWHSDDVLLFRSYVTRKAYYMEITNQTTGESHTFHVDCNLDDALQKKAHQPYTMVAASYCPVVQGTQVWDARSGAIFRGLRFYNIKTANFIESATCADDYKDAKKYDFMPSDSSIYSYGFTQGDDNADYQIGSDEKGTYLESNIYYIEN